MGVITRLVAFDMDGTLLDGRVIYAVGRKMEFLPQIQKITASTKVPYVRSRKIAMLLRGISLADFNDIVGEIPLMQGAAETISTLKARGITLGIISDSYTQAAAILAQKLGLDFHIANLLELKGGYFTGSVIMPMGWEKIGCDCKQSVCKRYHLLFQSKRYSVEPAKTIAVGDSAADRCMIEAAGMGIWFRPKEDVPRLSRGHTVPSKDLRMVLNYI
ncbi:MAG: HAD-IB family phosphatase [Thaumarchaeota archaeon]|nr:HAD-IB family phosphatase [Nitrososphaerota archaeon]